VIKKTIARLRGQYWKCFHCTEEFYSTTDAELHFGEGPCCEPLCMTLREFTDEDAKQLLIENIRVHESYNRMVEKHDELEDLVAMYKHDILMYKTKFDSVEYANQKHEIRYLRDIIDFLSKRYPEILPFAKAYCAGEPDKAHLYEAT
jgi:hypothetical protein